MKNFGASFGANFGENLGNFVSIWRLFSETLFSRRAVPTNHVGEKLETDNPTEVSSSPAGACFEDGTLIPTPEFLSRDFLSATRSRMEILTKENLFVAKPAPTAISRTFPPSIRRIRFPSKESEIERIVGWG